MAYYTHAMVRCCQVRSYSEVENGTVAYVKGVGMSRCIVGLGGTVGNKGRDIVVGMTDTLVGTDEIVGEKMISGIYECRHFVREALNESV